MDKIVIIGAGPAGLLLAHYILRRGRYRVEIYERRPDPRLVKQSQQRTFPLTLQLRGMNAIRTIPGLEAALVEKGIWSRGAMLHRKTGSPRQIERKMPLLLTDRNQLIQVLLQQLVERHKESVTVTFDCPCISVEERAVTLQPQAGETFTVPFDQLVGADGARSQVREALENKGLLHSQQSVVPDVYKSLFVPRVSEDKTAELVADKIHTWSLGDGIRIIMAPQADDWLHGTLIFPPDKNPLESLNTNQDVLAYFRENCPQLGQLMTLDEAEALRLRPVSKLMTVSCDRMHVNNILMIGDAVHAVSASIGQGCNASLQDAQIFNECLDRYQDDWEQALPAFTAQRLPDVHALRELSNDGFPQSKRMRLEFIFRMTVGKKLKLPLKPLPIQLIMDSDLPYSEVLKQTEGWRKRVQQSMQTT
ncbi:Kynurenine 3-monooxygenase [Acaryochloris thomasi RCC1774]|uniref:Kynurenine 3-monooxygenase n=1 Tax=Acaryochloris thomasi RCC1774 TaxID=1764569 RepID=A0A2W1JMI6_9CYAN|nr:NAD(P)/FAD-dependent oxidoreductase [Acaryochloris thomasi]PZD70491.1 Kynurenine 3-monooxygenase [Acaryochloris thomasi RCC1774]